MAKQSVDWTGKTAVITGAGSGIGQALALRLARAGANVAVSDRTVESAEATAHACRTAGAKAQAYAVDVADRDAVFAHAADVLAEFGSVDLVVNNAGVALHGPVTDLEFDDMQWLMNINYWGVVHGTQAFLPALTASKGDLVNISSVFGLIAVPKQAAYNAAKFAVRGFTEALIQETLMDGSGVKVHCVHPGGIKTNIAKSARATKGEAVADMSSAFDKVAFTTPAKAAKVILTGVEKNKTRILIGADAYGIAALPRLLGARYMPLVVKRFQKMAL